MGYQEARSRIAAYRTEHIGGLINEHPVPWFLSAFGSIREMLSAFSSNDENLEIMGNYATGTDSDRTASNIKLDYVCGLRREVRKQYVSGEDGIYTDVTPFRHGMMSAHGGSLFDSALDQVITHNRQRGGH